MTSIYVRYLDRLCYLSNLDTYSVCIFIIDSACILVVCYRILFVLIAIILCMQAKKQYE